MTKYKEYFQKMLEANKDTFDNFKAIHDNFSLNQDESLRSQFNFLGEKVIEIIRDYENRLCMHSEKSGYGLYSSNLSEKFWDEIRKFFPLIDQVGIKVEYAPAEQAEKPFFIKKINLF